MAIGAGQISIVDVEDGLSLSCQINVNQPRIQVKDVNAGTFAPNWATSPNVVLTPVIYYGSTQLPLDSVGLSYEIKRRPTTGIEGNLIAGKETWNATNHTLTISDNVLADTVNAPGAVMTYLVRVAYVDPETTIQSNAVGVVEFAMVPSGANGANGADAKSCWISGEQVFKYSVPGGAASPLKITLTANLQGVSVDHWEYKDASGNWQTYPVGGDNTVANAQSWVVTPADAAWNGANLTIRVITSAANIGDTTSIYKVTDGATGGIGPDGNDASVAFLSNENVTFAGNKDGQVAAVNVTCNVVAYTGTNKVTPVVGGSWPQTPVAGMTVEKLAAVNSEIPIKITIASLSTLGAAGPTQGSISIPITSPVAMTLVINWSKVNTGATGATGADSIRLTLYAPNGEVFQNQAGQLIIKAAPYIGSTELTTANADFQWAKYTGGSWVDIAGQTGTSLTVNGTDVNGLQSYQCRMRYPKTTGAWFQDVYTLTDKTDSYQVQVESTGGNIFKNTVGTSFLTCRLFQNGVEADAAKSAQIVAALPTSGMVAGQYCYLYNQFSSKVQLYRYSGTVWEDVTANASYKHAKTYKWYRRDKDGNAMDGGAPFSQTDLTGTPKAVGKIIFVNGDDVTVKTTFICEVE